MCFIDVILLETDMPYELNPHRHVKIWLSKNPESFLNPENQLRLVRMRAKNPDDTIHFVYAKSLLTERSLSELNDFCKKHNIIPVPIEDEVLPRCADNEQERNLAEIYGREISALNAGGNVAAASDILRWLSPVYSLGIYSDFDVEVNTTHLGPTITVDAPILVKLGSTKISTPGLPKSNLEGISLNNDSIAVISDDLLAIKAIQKIQRKIYKAYLDPEIYVKSLEKTCTDICGYFYGNKQIYDEAALASFASRLAVRLAEENKHLIRLLGFAKPDPIALRKAILDQSISDTLGFEDPAELRNLFRKMISDPYTSTIEREKLIQYLELPNAELIEAFSENYNQELIKKSVQYTTGPMPVILGLFGHCVVPLDIINEEIKPYSFHHNGLHEAFYSENYFDFHLEPHVLVKKIYDGNVGDSSDQSWIKEGSAAVIKRENKMHQAATIIQRMVRENLSRKKAQVFFRDSQEDSNASTSDAKPKL